MSSIIKLHDQILRNELRKCGGHEAETLGDGFMISFQTSDAALLWSLSIQSVLSAAPWPFEILAERSNRNCFRKDTYTFNAGLSVRIGIHWGTPQCELNPVTHRMDYLGDMVNGAARISSLADGSEVAVAETFLCELQGLVDAKVGANIVISEEKFRGGWEGAETL